ncbi:hypothetical protein FGO68_gene8772 [Halteria grandinella]|uniref:DUF6869 domain-containing protein n=1 Tax=Halteria grandinella TaxID=5974 RepID=A0A8J8NBR6_HALGN|nr:hypothetical protein FGO68_gene8772 [Halteria grandinella]
MEMPIDHRWNALNDLDWEAFARAWLAELRGDPESPDSEMGQTVVMMNFTAAPEHQWKFIRCAVAASESDDDLNSIAAGPLEHLLGKHSENWIEAVEDQSARDPKFAKMIGGVWKSMMPDKVWDRVQKLQARDTGTSGPESG